MKFTIVAFLYLFLVFGDVCMAQNSQPSPDQVRNMIEAQIESLNVPKETVAKAEDKVLLNGQDTVRIRIYYPDSKKGHRIIYNIHGGAFVAGNLETHDNISRILCSRTASVVVAVDYRKPVAFPFPASIEDCAFVLNWIRANASSINGKTDELVLLGDSAGGLFVAALAVKMGKDLKAKKLVLINPAVDLRNYENGPYALVCHWYMNGKDPATPLASPVVAEDLSSFPPTLIVTAELDYLKAQGELFAERLKKAGVSVTLKDIPKEDHLGGLWATGHSRSSLAVAETLAFVLAK